jgi:hypothetical protein
MIMIFARVTSLPILLSSRVVLPEIASSASRRDQLISQML